MEILKRQSKSNYPIKVMQFGGGNFLRAYIDWMIDVLNTDTDFEGDVLLIKPTERGDYKALKEQDGLFHVVTKGVKENKLVNESHLVTCIQKIIHPYLEWEAYLNSAKNPTIRFIVSNTTESGITFSSTDSFTDKPPKEFPAKLTQWLWARFIHFDGAVDKGCLFLPCELIEHNGDKLKNCILQYAAHWKLNSSFNDWINQACHFSNTLVDRIVTGFPKEVPHEFYEKIANQDNLLVEAEPYHLLVIEAPIIFQNELAFDQTSLNVVFTNNLHQYREIKVRLLNGAHTAMVPVAYLAGLRTVKESIDHIELHQFIQNILFENIIPTLDYPKEDLHKYVNEVIDRFKNPFIKHQLIDISLNSISKFKTRLLPSLLEYKKRTGQLPKYIVQALGSLIVFYRGSYNGESIPLRESPEIKDFFSQQWGLNQNLNKNENEKLVEMIEVILKNETLWGRDLSSIEDLNAQIVKEIIFLLDQQSVS